MQWWDGSAWGPLAPTAAPIVIHTRPMKDSGIAYLLLILLGGFAAHRFYLGYTASAVTMLLLWWIGWALSVVMVGFLMIGAVVVHIRRGEKPGPSLMLAILAVASAVLGFLVVLG